MKSSKQAMENMEYVRRLLEQKQPGFAASLEFAASLAETSQQKPMDDELIRLCAAAARVACWRMTPRYLKALHDSVEWARHMPSSFAWDRKAASHAEIFNLLADAAGDPVLAVPLQDARGHILDLMVTVGPAADGIILSSRRRLLALMRVRDADAVAREIEQHLGGLLWMRCMSGSSAWSGIAVCPA
jgi:DNA-binding FadR family transcriptional regulator